MPYLYLLDAHRTRNFLQLVRPRKDILLDTHGCTYLNNQEVLPAF